MTAIVVDDLRKAYGSHLAVDGVSFSVADGEVVAILGPNGAGKTTTVEILEGFRARDGGSVRVLGDDPAHPSRAFRERVGVVLQETRPDPYLTVAETVELARGCYPRPLAMADVLDVVGLAASAPARTATLSGGQQRRLDLALGLVGDPVLLFLDEPTTGFDPSARREAWASIRRLRERGTTVVLTTHYLDEAEALADRLVVLAAGRVVADGAPDAIGGRDRVHRIEFALSDTTAAPRGGAVVGGRWCAEVTDVTRALHELTTWALDRGIVLDDLVVERPRLEDVYLELIA